MNAGLCSRRGEAIPLEGVEVEGEVLGAHARVVVRQRYRNTSQRPVEAVYTFPLPSDATLTGFSMTCEGRRFEGAVKEREAAFRAYDDAVVAGHGAALVEQERANVFTASVGNLLPGEETLVEVEYVQRVQVDEGSLRWMIPTLVAPRYIPGSPDGDRTAHGQSAPTDRVPDADRITPPRAPEVPYGLRLDLVFDLGREVRVESPSHAIAVTTEGPRARVRLAQPEVALDRDVVLTARGVAQGVAQTTGLAAHRAPGADGYLALSVVPDLYHLGAEASRDATAVFLVDVSGSMEGDAIREARAALRLCLRHLRAGDRFNVIAFSSSHRAFEREPVPFTEATLARADRWIEALQADGGTELLAPLTLATSMAAGGVVVLLTDGQVGDEDAILRAVLKRRGEARTRVCSFGIGTNVSDALLRELARETGGAVEFIYPGERIDEKVVAQFSRAVAPRITDVTVRFTGVDAGEATPARALGLVDGEAWTLFARYARGGAGSVELRGRYGAAPFELVIPLDLPDEASRPVVAKLWAAERIRDLEDARVEGRRAEAMRQRIVELAVAHGVASRFTSFVVVEHRSGDRRAAGMPETVVVPVSLPAGWAMFEAERSVDELALDAGGRHVNKTTGAPIGAARRKRAMPPPAARAAPVASAAMPPKPAEKLVARDEPMDVFAPDDDVPVVTAGCSDDDFELAAAPLAQPAGREAKERAKGEAAPTHGATDLGALFARQLASGLWDDPSLGADGPARRLRATARALQRLAREGVDTTHALYGAPLRKALEAVAALAATLAASEAALCELALAAAWTLATGQRTRDALSAAIEKGGYPALTSLRQNPVALRRWVEAAGA